MNDKPKELEEHSAQIFELGCMERPVYLKEDVDAVIAGLKADYKEACDRLQTANLIKDEQLAATRHHKFKRCAAMAEMCKARYDEEDAKVNGCGASWEYISKEMKYWERWRNRWLKIAEKLKEVTNAVDKSNA